MLWMIFIALLTVVLVLLVLTICKLELNRVASSRVSLASFFLAISFAGLSAARFTAQVSVPEGPIQPGQPVVPSISFGTQTLGILAGIAGAIGLFCLVSASVQIARSQTWPRKNEMDEEDEEDLEDEDMPNVDRGS
jgi:hypothetical protein